MKTKISRFLTMALVLALVLAMSIPVFAVYQTNEDFAATNYALTVSGNELSGKKVTAIRMFTVSGKDVDGDGICYQDDITYTLDAAWNAFFTAADADGGLAQAAPADDDYSKAMHDYVFGLSTDAARADLAKKAKAWVAAHPDSFLTTGDDPLQFVETGSDANTATFANLKAGYYLVYPDSGSTQVGRATDAILVNVPMNKDPEVTTDPVLQLKTEYPTVEKKVDGQDATSAQVGDSVSFTLTSKIPNMEEYTEYKFVFQDTMSEGLSYNTGSIHVYLGDSTQELNAMEGDKTNYEVAWNGTTRILTVTFNNLKQVENATAGTAIKVTYTARLTEKAVTTGKGTNEALVEYSNDPKTDGTGKSTPDVTEVYTFPITIDKYTSGDGNYGDGTTGITHLPGAVFELRTTETATGDAIKLVRDTPTGNTYHVASFNELNDGTVEKLTQVKTPNDGKITINGLKAGTYYLHEVTPPEGYNKLANPVKIVIEADLTKDPVTPTYKIDNDATGQESSTIPVLNEKGAVLPGTGSIGTIGLTILGVSVVSLAIFLPGRKKKKAV